MEKRKFAHVSWLIGIASTLAILVQVYWNVENYQVLAQETTNEIQASFDAAVNQYYMEHAKSLMGQGKAWKFKTSDSASNDLSVYLSGLDQQAPRFDSLKSDSNKSFNILIQRDSLSQHHQFRHNKDLITTLVFSIQGQQINLDTLKPFVTAGLAKKEIDLEFELLLDKKDTLILDGNRSIFLANPKANPSKGQHQLYAQSSFLPAHLKLSMEYGNPVQLILMRGILGIGISLAVNIIIIFSLYYLWKVIRQQKELSEIKDDFVSNISHEFKTPIAAVSSALEAIQHFSPTPAQQQEYLELSKEQLTKLNQMVERLLDVATLSSGSIQLSKQKTGVNSILARLKEQHSLITPEKHIALDMPEEEIRITADPMHLENAIGNLLDNAVKYGGNAICLRLALQGNKLQITVEDNGGQLSKQHLKRIFDKLYRVPQGNTHNVKGYGLGLFYAKEIIEAHGGSLTATIKDSRTQFKIELPYV